MVNYLRDNKTGKFTGSIGAGKNKTPQPTQTSPHIPKPLTGEDYLTMIALIDPRAISQNLEIQQEAARATPLDRTIAEHLMKKQFPDILPTLAVNPTLDLDLLIKLSTSHKPNVVQSVVATGRLPTQQLMKLATKRNEETQSMIAQLTGNPKVLDKLSQKGSKYVKYYIARNPATTPKTLTKLSHTNDTNVRSAVASHPNTPPKTLQKLSKDLNKFVRNSIIDNPKTSKNIIENISPLRFQ